MKNNLVLPLTPALRDEMIRYYFVLKGEISFKELAKSFDVPLSQVETSLNYHFKKRA